MIALYEFMGFLSSYIGIDLDFSKGTISNPPFMPKIINFIYNNQKINNYNDFQDKYQNIQTLKT